MISVFISSTFKDMRAERDLLHNVVFPGIRNEILPRGEDIQEIDLRWGVDTSRMSEEKSSRYVITTCLDVIDQCRPYLIVLLGERYGWIPDGKTVAHLGDSRLTELFAGDISITNAEILYGALQRQEALDHCIFCFRDPDFMKMLPESRRADYEEETEAHAAKLEKLKQEIRASGAKILTYAPVWDEEKMALSGLSSFSEDLTAALREMIEKDLPERRTDLCEEEVILAETDHKRKQLISDYANRTAHPTYQKGSAWIYGARGVGKSAFLAKEASRGIGLGYPVFLYFGGMPGCSETGAFLRTLYYWLLKKNGEEILPVETRREMTEDQLKDAIRDLASKMKELYLFVDEPEAMDRRILPTLMFLAEEVIGNLPGKTMNVASSDRYALMRPAISDRFRLNKMMELTEEQQRNLIRLHAEKRWKHVDDETADVILGKKNSCAKYLTLVLDRLFMMNRRDFEASDNLGAGMSGLQAFMQEEIRRLPEDTVGLSLYLLQCAAENLRGDLLDFESCGQDGGAEDPLEIMTWLAVSENGLPVREIGAIVERRGHYFPAVLLERLLGSLQETFEADAEGRWRISDGELKEHLLRQMTRETLSRAAGDIAAARPEEADPMSARLLLLQGDIHGAARIAADPGRLIAPFTWICDLAEKGVPAFEELLSELVRLYPEACAEIILPHADDLLLFEKLKQMMEKAAEEPGSGIRTSFAVLSLIKNETDRALFTRCGQRVLRYFEDPANLEKADARMYSLLADALVPVLVYFQYSSLRTEAFGVARKAASRLPEQDRLKPLYDAMVDWADFYESKPAALREPTQKKAWCDTAEAFAGKWREKQPDGKLAGLFRSWVLFWIGAELTSNGAYGAGLSILRSVADCELIMGGTDGYWYHYLRGDTFGWLQDAVKKEYKEKYLKLELDERILACALFPCTGTMNNLMYSYWALGKDQRRKGNQRGAEETWQKGTEVYEYFLQGKGIDLAKADSYSMRLYFAQIKEWAWKYFADSSAADGESYRYRWLLEKYRKTLSVVDKCVTLPMERGVVSDGYFELGEHLFMTKMAGANELLRKGAEINEEVFRANDREAIFVLRKLLFLLEADRGTGKDLFASADARKNALKLAEECLARAAEGKNVRKEQFRLDLVKAADGDKEALGRVKAFSPLAELDRLFVLAADPELPVAEFAEAFRSYWKLHGYERVEAQDKKKFQEQVLLNILLRKIREMTADVLMPGGRTLQEAAAAPEVQAVIGIIRSITGNCWAPEILDGNFLPDADFCPDKQGWIRAALLYRNSADYNPAIFINMETCAAIFLMEEAEKERFDTGAENGTGTSMPEKEMMLDCYFRGSLFLKNGLPGAADSLSESLEHLGAYAEKNGFSALARKFRMKQFVFLYLEDRAQELEGAPEYAAELIRSFEDCPDETDRLAKKAEGQSSLRTTAEVVREYDYLAFRMLLAEQAGSGSPDHDSIIGNLTYLCGAFWYICDHMSKAMPKRGEAVTLHIQKLISKLVRKYPGSGEDAPAEPGLEKEAVFLRGLIRASDLWLRGAIYSQKLTGPEQDSFRKAYLDPETVSGWKKIADFAARAGHPKNADYILYNVLWASANSGEGEPYLSSGEFSDIIAIMETHFRPCFEDGLFNTAFATDVRDIWNYCASKYTVSESGRPCVAAFASFAKKAADLFREERYHGSGKDFHLYNMLIDAYFNALRALHEYAGADIEEKTGIEKEMISYMKEFIALADTSEKKAEIDELNPHINFLMDDGIACRREASELRNGGPKAEIETLETEALRFLGQHPGATLDDFRKYKESAE